MQKRLQYYIKEVITHFEKKYPGVRLSLSASIDTIRQDISMDIGFGDVVIPCPSELDYPNLIYYCPLNHKDVSPTS